MLGTSHTLLFTPYSYVSGVQYWGCYSFEIMHPKICLYKDVAECIPMKNHADTKMLENSQAHCFLINTRNSTWPLKIVDICRV